MASLKTVYTGVALENPLVVAACSLSSKVDTIKAVADAGAGGLVIKSLFEEQILHERGELEKALNIGAEKFAESVTYFPQLEHAGAEEHLMWIRKTRRAVKMPLFASLNAVSPGNWIAYARQLEETGVDGIELNTYAVEADPERDAADIEKRLGDLVAGVTESVSVPVTVKMSPFYTCFAHVARRMETAGADGLVLFNRFLQPDIDPDTEKPFSKMTWSTPREMMLPMRWIGLLYGRTGMDLIGNTGAARGTDLAKYILAGATAVQAAGALLQSGIAQISNMLQDLEQWMDGKGYADLQAFRGKCSQAEFKVNPAVYERAQYVDFILRSGNR
ncbi:MAG: dihydroorotate dehydrogenase-like protein [Lentisphaerae bacterium]|nr:dihydroorotate dehydrogenase-like protein [Lentisphaerota bacterium]